MKSKRIIGIILLLALIAGIVLVINLRPKSNDASQKLSVTASYYPLYDFAKNIGGDKAVVTNITPAGSEPHDYEPTPQQLVATQKSAVFIYNGATMEQWVTKFLPDYKAVVVKASQNIPLRQGTNENGSPDATTADPHFWLDPVLAQQIVKNILAGFIQADPSSSAYFTANANTYIAKLAALDSQFKQGLATCNQRTVVTSHAAFSYIGSRYNLNIVAIAGITPGVEPSAAKLAELSNLVRQNHINYVFFESLASPKLADTIAAETGAKTAVFDPIEGLTESAQQQGKSYISVQQQNLQNLRVALGCR
ncbi:MAG TPA: zinc ABC transporter substrate-binding protein [Candidatus Saccharimonadales bacterium]